MFSFMFHLQATCKVLVNVQSKQWNMAAICIQYSCAMHFLSTHTKGRLIWFRVKTVSVKVYMG